MVGLGLTNSLRVVAPEDNYPAAPGYCLRNTTKTAMHGLILARELISPCNGARSRFQAVEALARVAEVAADFVHGCRDRRNLLRHGDMPVQSGGMHTH